MSGTVAIVLFCVSLLLSMASSAVLAERLDQLGHKFHFRAGLLGIITALGADAPEIAASAAALLIGHHDLGRGVIFGSNIFNIAFLFGLSASIAGWVRIGRNNFLLNGGVSLLVTLIVGAQAMGWLGSVNTGVLLALLLIPYVMLSALAPSRLSVVPIPKSTKDWLISAVSAAERGGNPGYEIRPYSWADGLAIVPLTVLIALMSIAMVQSAEFLGRQWGLDQVVVGTFVVATLTGIPNLIAALRLAMKGRGAALSSESFNSNSLNLLVGAYVPSLFFHFSSPSSEARLLFWWLIGMTFVATVVGAIRGGFGRLSGAVLLGAYAAFAVVIIW